jgi:hypothetical protein
MATGENSTTWGAVTNTNLGTTLEEAIVGSADVTFSSADTSISLSNSNATQTARHLRLNLTGTTGGVTRALTVPDVEKVYMVNNACADAVEVKNSTGSNVSVPAGKSMWVYSTGSSVVDATTHLTSLTLGTDLAVAEGGTGISELTAESVLVGNGTNAVKFLAPGTSGNVITSTGSGWTSESPGVGKVIAWGRVAADGTLSDGAGCTAARTALGYYEITLDTDYGSTFYAVVATLDGRAQGSPETDILDSESFQMRTYGNYNFTEADSITRFIVVG